MFGNVRHSKREPVLHRILDKVAATVLAFRRLTAVPKGPASTGLSHPPHRRSRLRKAPLLHVMDFDGNRTVLMLGSGLGNLAKPRDWLADQSISMTWTANFAKARSMMAQRQLYSHLMIDLDQLGGIHRVFDTLRALRKDVPDLPVILVSQAFSLDKFDLDRIWLCDASLRAPVTGKALEFALTLSEYNNEIWKARCLTGQSEIAPHHIAAE